MPKNSHVELSGTAFSQYGKLHEASAMYEGLRTNIPVDLMSYRDFPFKRGNGLFLERFEILDYLKRFGNYIGLNENIRYNTRVVDIKRISTGPTVWLVTSVNGKEEHHEQFDRVILANGMCSVPRIPNVPGLEHFRGTQVHSAWYRTPTVFRNKRVLIVGNFSSGTDIAREICGGSVRNFAGGDQWQRDVEAGATNTKVFQSYLRLDLPPPLDYDPRDASSPDWCRRIQVVGKINHVAQDGALQLTDGSRLNVDTIVWATGFWRSMPFLNQNNPPFDENPLIPFPGTPFTCPPNENVNVFGNKDVSGTTTLTNMDDWQIFYKPDPTMAIIGAPIHNIPFPFMQVQARAVASYWANLIPKLPQLSPNLSSLNPERWTTHKEHEPLGNIVASNHSVETPSEEAYIDALVELLPGDDGKTRPPWDHDLYSRGPEGWHKIPTWRRDRMQNRIALRRAELGY